MCLVAGKVDVSLSRNGMIRIHWQQSPPTVCTDLLKLSVSVATVQSWSPRNTCMLAADLLHSSTMLAWPGSAATYPWQQWPAVSTYWSDTRAPPQLGLSDPFVPTPVIQGYSFTWWLIYNYTAFMIWYFTVTCGRLGNVNHNVSFYVQVYSFILF